MKMASESNNNNWWHEGVRFQCQGSGNCCVSRGEYGYVYLTLEDRKRFAFYFNMATSAFTRKYCEKTEELWHLKSDKKSGDCIFLKDRRCSTYNARPTQCRTWPFWPEVMSAKAWKSEVIEFCPGAGKGKIVPASTIRKKLLEQELSEADLMGPDRLVNYSTKKD
jgi:hypothetical protein